MGVNRQFPAKTAKYKNHNISETINPIKTKFEDQAETANCISCVIVWIKSNMAADVMTPPTIVWLLWNLATRCKMTCRWRFIHQNRNRK